jgi:peptidoglycan/LPS O-acetylase OafA/YrhL
LTATETGEVAAGATYRPHLDGLRALAVYLVVLFHAGSSAFSGGYIGVDVFFVLSGYLVTQLLLRDIAAMGSIRFGRFYSRRFRRLLPAAFVALIVTALVFTAIAAPAEVVDTVGSFKAAFLYATNWYFIHHASGYFGANLTGNPVLQFWSLAVEEQFYLLWPIVLGGAFFASRRMDRDRQLRVLRIGLAVAAVASAVWALSLRNSDPNRAYYGTDTRAYELLAGGLLALAPAFLERVRRRQRYVRGATLLGILALVGVATSTVHLDAIERGVAVTIITCVLLVAIETADGGIVQRALSSRSMVYLGKISYGTYLWHWIVILVALRTFHLRTTPTVAVAALVATALASLSFEILEHPIRISRFLDGHRRTVIAAGLAISVVSALAIIPKVADPANAAAPTIDGNTAGFATVPSDLDWRDAAKNLGPFVNCYKQPVSACTIVHGTGKHILLMGDSHAHMMIPTFTAIARQDNLTLSVSVKGGCPWQRQLFATPVKVFGKLLRKQDCVAQKEDLYKRVIPQLHPDIIVVMNLAHEDPTQLPFLGPHDEFEANGTAQSIQWLDRTTADSIRELRGDGAKVVILEPIPVTRFNPLDCISKAKTIEQCSYVESRPSPDPLEAYYRQLAKRDTGVLSTNLDRLVCPFLPICDPVVDGQIVKWDPTHLTVRFAEAIAPQVNSYLQASGLLR